MATTEDKLLVLSQIGNALNKANVTWAVGASLMLYLNKKTDHFNDIDLMTTETDIQCVKKILQKLGRLLPTIPNENYQTKHFLEFTVDGVDVDVMSGLVIVHDGINYDCSLNPVTITSETVVNGVSIPLQSLAEWRKYYELMGRQNKVAMIDRSIATDQ